MQDLKLPRTMTLPAIAYPSVASTAVYATPAMLALTLGRGVWVGRSPFGESVLFVVTSQGRLLMDGPIVLAPHVSTVETEDLLWRMLDTLDPPAIGLARLARPFAFAGTH
jgi:hypothetical protein